MGRDGPYDVEGLGLNQDAPTGRAAAQVGARTPQARMPAARGSPPPHDLHASVQQQSLARARERAAAQRDMFAAFAAPPRGVHPPAGREPLPLGLAGSDDEGEDGTMPSMDDLQARPPSPY